MFLRKFFHSNLFQLKPLQSRFFSTSSGPIPVKTQKQLKEKEISEKLKNDLKATFVEVIDTSNSGCGQMYRMTVESPLFAGKSKIQQHRMVNEALAAEIKSMHGLNIKTSTPKTE